eukprot:888469-Rhodomonas_salina.1
MDKKERGRGGERERGREGEREGEGGGGRGRGRVYPDMLPSPVSVPHTAPYSHSHPLFQYRTPLRIATAIRCLRTAHRSEQSCAISVPYVISVSHLCAISTANRTAYLGTAHRVAHP